MNRVAITIFLSSFLSTFLASGQQVPAVQPWMEPQYVIQVWNNTNGLPQNTIFDLSVDTDGYLWVATEEGLVRYDGNDFHIIDENSNPKLRSSYFLDLTRAAGRGVWAVCENHIVKAYKNNLELYDLNNHISNAVVTRIAEDERGWLWIGTSNGRLLLLHEGGVVNYSKDTARQLKAIQVLQSTSGGMLVGTENGLFKIPDMESPPAEYPELKGLNIRSIAVDSDRSVWAGTRENGLFRVTAVGIEQFTEAHGLNDLFVNSLSVAPDGDLWVGTSSSGLQIYAEGQFESIDDKRLSENDIRCILHTDQGLTWLGTSGSGVVQMEKARIRMLTPAHGLSGKIALPIYQHANGDIWVGTAGNGLNLIRQGEIRHFNRTNGLANDIVLSICGTNEAIYVGTPYGLNRYNLQRGQFDRLYTEKDGLASNIVQVVFLDSQNRLWVAGRSGGIHQLTPEGRIERIGVPEKFRDAEFTTVFEDRNKNLWFGSYGAGILCLRNTGELRQFTLHQGLSANKVNGFYEDIDGTMWFATEAGLGCYVNNRFEVFTKANGLKFNGLHNLIADGEGYLWLSGNFGLQRIALEDLQNLKQTPAEDAVIDARMFGTSDGMANPEANGSVFPAAWQMNDGSVWFPTVEGVAIVQPELLNQNNRKANIHIQSIRYGEVENTTLERVHIPAGVFNIEVAFSSINFTAPAGINYHYRLQGLNRQWLDAGNRRVVYFTNLDPGSYIFEVKAEENGRWSETASFPFTVQPFFYQTTWFRGSLIMLLFTAGFFFRQYYSKYRQGAKLRALVDEQTSELLKSNERLKSAINSIETQNLKLKEIAWIQSHIVRAPLARMLGIINLIRNYSIPREELTTLLMSLEASGKELDEIIRDIVKKTENVKKGMEDEKPNV